MGKRYRDMKERIDNTKYYCLEDAMKYLKETATARFDETVDLSMQLGVDPRHPDQVVRGAVLLPFGTGREVRVLVFAKGEKEKEALDAGADYVGGEDMIDKIAHGWLDFDKVVATPDMMGMVGKIGKILGPRGLMPNPKFGTVTFEIVRAVKELKLGKIEYKVDRGGNMHASFGKASFDEDKLKANLITLVKSIIKAKPSSSKGTYVKNVTVSATMGPAIRLDPVEIRNMFK